MNFSEIMKDTCYSSALNSFSGALTVSVVMLQVIKGVTPFEYNLYEFIGGIILAYMMYLLSKENIRNYLKKYTDTIILFDIITFVISQLICLESLIYRFLAVTILFPICSELRNSILSDYINTLLQGVNITNFNQQVKYFTNVGFLLGLLFSTYLSSVDYLPSLETALIIQVIGFIPHLLILKVWSEFKEKHET